jgi:hypothetical protein
MKADGITIDTPTKHLQISNWSPYNLAHDDRVQEQRAEEHWRSHKGAAGEWFENRNTYEGRA